MKLPSTLSVIGHEMFWGCTALESCIISSAVTSIGTNAYTECISFCHIDLPGSIIQIEGDAFSNCYNLESINIPDAAIIAKANDIHGDAFGGCRRLEEISESFNMKIVDYFRRSLTPRKNQTKSCNVDFVGSTSRNDRERGAILRI